MAQGENDRAISSGSILANERHLKDECRVEDKEFANRREEKKHN